MFALGFDKSEWGRSAQTRVLGGVAERSKALVLKTSVPSRDRGFESLLLRHGFLRIGLLEKYPSGRRGSPAKGVGWFTPARGFKSLLLRHFCFWCEMV